jgi:MoaA/NifB/PqqE/SkfB family radical SAM enzyme
MEKQRLNSHIYVTPKCNLKCKHCYSAYNNVDGDLISIADIINIVTFLTEEYDVYFDVEGGELFIRNDIGELFAGLDTKHLNRITITTNGTIFPDIDPKYFRELDEFRVSIEGHNDMLHEDLRGVSLQNILKNCQKWNESDIPVVLRMTLNKKNVLYIPDMFERFTSLGFKRFSLYEFQPVGRGGINTKDYELAEEEIDNAMDLISRAAVKYRSEVEYIKLSLSKTRNGVVDKNKPKLLHNKLEIYDLSDIPSLTVNYNGELGYCPWELNSRHLGYYEGNSFMKNVKDIIRMQASGHNCSYCTSTRILSTNR